MAEFVQTMKDWRRMCKTIGVESCEGCKLHADGNDCVAVYEGEMDYAKLEKAVTEWAAEHPEPVYPSWIDWLMSEGVIPTNYMVANSTDSGVRAGTFYVTSKAFEPIPADIAHKLWIEPKEG